MKKISLLFVMLLALAGNAMAQSTVPVPADPDEWQLDWIDGVPFIHSGDGEWKFNSQFMVHYGMDIMSNLVANDYSFEIDSIFTHTLGYTILDKDKFSYSIYTDFDEIFVFNPDEYPEFDVPTTNVYPFLLLYDDFNDKDTYHSTPHFEYWFVHFEKKTNNVDALAEEGVIMEPFFRWRIGIQTHYTVDGVTTNSNIVYLEVFPKPAATGDVNMDGVVSIADVADLVDYLAGTEVVPFSKFNADLIDDAKITIADVTALIDSLLGAPAK